MIKGRTVRIIQGGMGANVSDWRLARTVSQLGQVGTVSSTAIELIIARELQLGDPGGHYRRALAHFPNQDIANRIISDYFIEDGKRDDAPFKGMPTLNLKPSTKHIEHIVALNFAVVWLAKEGHDGLISINLLEKIQPTIPFSIYGAMLAGVDIVTMGAGLPIQVSRVLSDILAGNKVTYLVNVSGREKFEVVFDQEKYFPDLYRKLTRPVFLPIVTSFVAANYLKDGADGFVVELPIAGGHNAPPRNRVSYGPKDEMDYEKLRSLGKPFWIGGGFASPEGLAQAIALDAEGIQTGSIFALSDESNLSADLKKRARELGFRRELEIVTSNVSPTGYPFKLAMIPGTLATDPLPIAACDIGYLVEFYEKPDGQIGRRCPSETVSVFLEKGGKEEETVGKCCLCNALLAAVDVGNEGRRPTVTLGDNVDFLTKLMTGPDGHYSAAEAVKYLLSKL